MRVHHRTADDLEEGRRRVSTSVSIDASVHPSQQWTIMTATSVVNKELNEVHIATRLGVNGEAFSFLGLHIYEYESLLVQRM